MPTVISRPCSAPAHRLPDDLDERGRPSAIRWSAANDAHDRVRVAAGDDRGGERDRRAGVPRRRLDEDVLLGQVGQLAGHRGRVRDAGDHAGCAPASVSGASRSTVACSSDASVPVSGCRNLGWPARDSGHSRVPLPPAGMTA